MPIVFFNTDSMPHLSSGVAQRKPLTAATSLFPSSSSEMATAEQSNPMQSRSLAPVAKGDDHGDGMILWFGLVLLGDTFVLPLGK
jgi:hypothetical protein